MTRTEILTEITTRFKDDILNVFDRSPRRVYIDIRPQALVRIVQCVFKELKARFNIASALDAREHMEILYHF